jgi:hypothetical protein
MVIHHIDVNEVGVVDFRQLTLDIREICAENTGVYPNGHWRQAIAFAESIG